jgi:hypothetical protein
MLQRNTLAFLRSMTMVQNQGNFETEEPVPTINEIAIKN